MIGAIDADSTTQCQNSGRPGEIIYFGVLLLNVLTFVLKSLKCFTCSVRWNCFINDFWFHWIYSALIQLLAIWGLSSAACIVFCYFCRETCFFFMMVNKTIFLTNWFSDSVLLWLLQLLFAYEIWKIADAVLFVTFKPTALTCESKELPALALNFTT